MWWINFVHRYDGQVPLECRFPPRFVFDSMKSYKVKIGLWIDLCNTSRFYNRKDVEDLGTKYVKLQCRGHGETPSEEQARYWQLWQKFAKKKIMTSRPKQDWNYLIPGHDNAMSWCHNFCPQFSLRAAQNDSKWLKMTQNDSKWLKMTSL